MGSIIGTEGNPAPAKDPDTGEREAIIRRILAAGNHVSNNADQLAAYGMAPPDVIIIRERLELLIDMVLPPHGDQGNMNTQAIQDAEATAEMPSTIGRLLFEERWHQTLRHMTSSMLEEVKRLPQNGGLTIVKGNVPGV